MLKHGTEPTVIRKLKRPDTMNRWAAYRVWEDELGVWLFSPKGTLYRGQTGSRIGECEVGQGDRDEGVPVIQLMPRSLWWTAIWSREHNARISVDICTPPARYDGEWTYVDLELDSVLRECGSVELVDEDEFDEACQTGLIVEEEAAEARTAGAETIRAMRGQSEPFNKVGWERLDQALSLALPPIRSLRAVPLTLQTNTDSRG